MKTHDANFASRPLTSMQQLAFQGAEGLVFAPYGDGWRQLRRICATQLLGSGSVRSFRRVREEELGRLLRSIVGTSHLPAVNLSRGVSAYVADSTVRAVIGTRFKERDAYLRILHDLLRIVPGMTLPDLFPSWRLASLVSSVPGRIKRHSRDMKRLMDTIIQERQQERSNSAAAGAGQDSKEEEEDCFLDVLLRLQKDVDSQYPLTTDNIKTVLLDMFGAGSETSATALEWAIAELLRNPRVMHKLQDEVRTAFAGHNKVTEVNLTNLHYLRLVIKETLRLHPPVPLLLPRQCANPCQVLGFDIPEGAMVIVNAWAIAQDPVHWDNPGEFAPERFEEENARDFKGRDYEFLPFGAGRRVCPGMAFGLAHIQLALAALLFHFDWKLPGGKAGEDLDMTEAFVISTRLRSDLLVVAVPRIPVPCPE
ncbi:hypothetical protein BRADI_4g04940v3 [Brachypodium distachyon]|uniref:Cytochrome P450 n=2 Tax=Brachypodium distachyon TaxID=15368 RepID=A0A0Q3PBE0_BRADI|nr:hypothetical protein BRADI_4g04940v3 [Brachypodium distachyon]